MPNLDELRTHLFTSVLSDYLDSVGYCHQAMPSRITSAG